MIKIAQLLKSIVSEGGGVFKDTEYSTKDIDRNDLKVTISKFTQELVRLFPNKKASLADLNDESNWLGSTGSAFKSGDVDLAYSVKHFFAGDKVDLAGWGVDESDFTALYEKYKKSARTASDDQIQLKALIELIVRKVNSESKELYASDKASGAGSIHFSFPQYTVSGEKVDGRTQLDLDIGDMEWLKFRYNSQLPKIDREEDYLRKAEAAAKEYYENPGAKTVEQLAKEYGIEVADLKKKLIKGLHRGQLMLAMFAAAGYTFKSGKGFIRKDTKEVVAATPEETIKVFNAEYKPKQPLTLQIIRSYDSLMQYIKDNLTGDEKQTTINLFKDAVRRAKAYEPDNVNL